MGVKMMKSNNLKVLTEMLNLNESVQEYTSESGKSTISFESSDKDTVKIKARLFVDFKLNTLPENYQDTFLELLEMLELD